MRRRPSSPRRATRPLTVKQAVVYAAVGRLGNPTVPELTRELHTMRASEIVRVLDALEVKERVAATGVRHWVYLGDPAGIPHAPQIPAEYVVRYCAI